MDYQVSARKYRPASFEAVIGQPHVVQTLMNAITTKRIAHAFLFSGTRGVGKTTVARILAKALNCERGPAATPCDTCVSCQEIAQGSSVDVIEIDGASNTGVDDVREIRENVKFTPFRGKYRVYIIDEVHMLSNSAFNALLKTLEEPPAHVVFVFATTEIHKIPATILSRCQHYNFRRISKAEIIERLRHVANEEGLTVEHRSLASIARASEGSMRDALSLLDQAVAFGGKSIRQDDLETLLGAVPQELVRAMIAAIRSQDSAAAVRVVAQLLDQGHDLKAYCADLVEHIRNLLVAAVVSIPPEPQSLKGLIDLSEEELHQIAADAKAFTAEQLQELFRIFSQAEDSLRLTAHPRFVLEVATVRATRLLHPSAPIVSATNLVGGGTSRAALPTPGPAHPPLQRHEAVRGQPPSAPPRPPEARTTQSDQPAPTRTVAGTVSSERPAPDPAKGNTASVAAKPLASVRPPAPVARPAGPASSPPPALASETPAKPAPVALQWETLVERVETVHQSLAPFLAQGTLLSIEGVHVTIGFPKTASVALSRMQNEGSLRQLTDLCTELTGQPVRLRMVELADGQSVGPNMAQIRAAKEREQKQALLEGTRSHPLVKQALEVFGGDLVDVRRVSPRKETSS
jgi:DNA polymerase-3 subunit gamma/tau